jgi:hypothetical protein
MDEFYVLFVPIFLIGCASIWFGFGSSINFLLNIGSFVLGGACMVICAFAILVQYINWKYYKE